MIRFWFRWCILDFELMLKWIETLGNLGKKWMLEKDVPTLKLGFALLTLHLPLRPWFLSSTKSLDLLPSKTQSRTPVPYFTIWRNSQTSYCPFMHSSRRTSHSYTAIMHMCVEKNIAITKAIYGCPVAYMGVHIFNMAYSIFHNLGPLLSLQSHFLPLLPHFLLTMDSVL